ncbi:LysR family transcriptional regulator [Pseudidiomarina sediminum]|uniref:LysR family transcriptional regulator n=1 Tax=Pseudidiomarina sediminum TaxID=431675 RepID=UPI001C987F0D|nr:LysR family transcriptional regulator [Pseudidiomarina sediminum]MBY6062706.1 LysR family transcriptional regulator [Pseudidiomarina sediminum]
MRLDRVDLNLFIVFEAIYREQSISKVAALLNLTQPAISNALARLRRTFNDPLFVRSPQGMLPTAVADNIIGDVRQALTLLQQSVGTTGDFQPQLSKKTFKLGMNDLTEYLTLTELMKTLQTEAPNALLTCYYIDRKKATEDLKSGALDILVDAASYNVEELHQSSLGKLNYVVAYGDHHPLNNQSLSLEDYLTQEHIHVSSRRGGKGQMDIALQALGHLRHIKMRVQNYQVAAKVVQQTQLLLTVPRLFAQAKGLSYCELPFTVEPMPINLYWHRSTTDDPANLWMREKIRNILSSLVDEDI